ncbi:hypothetical protein HK102_002575, partial [Quaeritorhiza haematococci]
MAPTTFAFVFLALLSVAAAQECALFVFEQCKTDMDVFLDATCGPLRNSNVTNFNACLCYREVNL